MSKISPFKSSWLKLVWSSFIKVTKKTDKKNCTGLISIFNSIGHLSHGSPNKMPALPRIEPATLACCMLQPLAYPHRNQHKLRTLCSPKFTKEADLKSPVVQLTSKRFLISSFLWSLYLIRIIKTEDHVLISNPIRPTKVVTITFEPKITIWTAV